MEGSEEQNCLFVPSSNPKNTNIYKSVINVRLPKAFLSSTQVDTLKFAIIPLNAYAIIQKLRVCSIILIGFLFGKGNTFQLCVLVVKIFPNVMVAVEKQLMCTMVISLPQTHCSYNLGRFLYPGVNRVRRGYVPGYKARRWIVLLGHLAFHNTCDLRTKVSTDGSI